MFKHKGGYQTITISIKKFIRLFNLRLESLIKSISVKFKKGVIG